MLLLTIEWPLELLKIGGGFIGGLSVAYILFVLNRKKEEKSYQRGKNDSKIKELKELDEKITRTLYNLAVTTQDVFRLGAKNLFLTEQIRKTQNAINNLTPEEQVTNDAVQALKGFIESFRKKGDANNEKYSVARQKHKELMIEFYVQQEKLKNYSIEITSDKIRTFATSAPEFNFQKFDTDEIADKKTIENYMATEVNASTGKLSKAIEEYKNKLSESIRQIENK